RRRGPHDQRGAARWRGGPGGRGDPAGPLDRRHWLRPGRPEPSPDRPLAAARGTRLRHPTVTLDRAIRPGLPTVARALIGYGIVGVIVAMVALVVLFVGLARLNGLSDRVRDLGGVPTVLERTATVLDS